MTVITRIYDDYAQARRACDAVNGLGLSGVDASILGNESLRTHYENDRVYADAEPSAAATGAGVGAAIGGGAGLLAGLGMLAIPGLGPVVAAGWVAATAVGALGGAAAGGAVGALTDLGVSEADAPVYSEAVRRGGLLVSARFPEDLRNEVESALDQIPQMPIDRLRRDYEADGWRQEDYLRSAERPVVKPPII